MNGLGKKLQKHTVGTYVEKVQETKGHTSGETNGRKGEWNRIPFKRSANSVLKPVQSSGKGPCTTCSIYRKQARLIKITEKRGQK